MKDVLAIIGIVAIICLLVWGYSDASIEDCKEEGGKVVMEHHTLADIEFSIFDKCA